MADAETSTVVLPVSISTNGSSAVSEFPTRLKHRPIVALEADIPLSGIRITIAMSEDRLWDEPPGVLSETIRATIGQILASPNIAPVKRSTASGAAKIYLQSDDIGPRLVSFSRKAIDLASR